MITLNNSRQLAEILMHLRIGHGLTRAELGDRIQVSQRTIDNREKHETHIPADGLIDTAAVFGFVVALVPRSVPARHPGARSTGTGWPT